LNEKKQENKTKGIPVIVVTSGKGGWKNQLQLILDINCRLGYKVVVIDADIGLKLRFIVGLENRILYTVMDVFEGQCRLDQALIRDKRWKNLSLLSISKPSTL
jgi:septum site-determining protein MinD